MPKQEQGIHQYIAKAQRTGTSQAETMRQLREGGFRFTDSTFRQLWGEIEHARDIRGDIADVNVGRRPLPNEISQITGGKIGDFLYRFDIMLRLRGTGEVVRTHVGIKSDKLITYSKAASQILQVYQDNEDQYESNLVGWIPAAVNEYTGD
jgi:hypothetical protein